jgi:hypothetical protein
MRVALVILCIGATTFFLRVVAALVKENLSWHPIAMTSHSSSFSRSRRRGKLIEMKPAVQKWTEPARAGKSMAR